MKQFLIASFVATLALSAQAQEVKGNADAGKNKNAMCTGCHSIPGYKTTFPVLYSVPMIAGQNAKYIENALAGYASGERNHPSMTAVAKGLSKQDMADLAAYYANLK